MKKGLLLIVLMVFGWVGIASAVTYTETLDLDVTLSEGVIASLFTDGYHAYSHSTPADFEVPYDVVNSATLSIDAYWVNGGNDPVYVEGSLAGNLTNGGSFENPSWDWSWSTWSYSVYNPGYDSPATTAFDILSTFDVWANGDTLDIIIQATQDAWYDFEGILTLASSTLTLDYDNDVAPVPEPSTLLLLGSGLAGFALYRRKRNS